MMCHIGSAEAAGQEQIDSADIATKIAYLPLQVSVVAPVPGRCSWKVSARTSARVIAADKTAWRG